MLLIGWACSALAAEPPLTFEKDVRPILKQHCFMCHGEEPQLRGGLDLRTVKMMAKGGHSGAAVQPGAGNAGELWAKVEADEMPEGPKKVSAAQKAVLKKWLEQGAKTARPEPDDPNQARFTAEELAHWAFQPVRAAAPPNVPAETDLDKFLLAKLRAAGVEGFAPSADRQALLRRITFDLHGLPPAPAELDAFLKDHAPDAYAKVVDRLLASPRYGERWGRHWLDVAGYSETYGNPGVDQLRPDAWRYRDYVVASFNADQRFDAFLQEQLAGDELAARPYDPADPRTVARLTATGFLRMPPDVTGVSNELADRNQAVADAVKVAAGAFLGLTVGCAQCHDHKYDPIPAEDYHQLRACFEPAFDLHHWQPPEQRVVDMTPAAPKAAAAKIEAQAVQRDAAMAAERDAAARKIFDRELGKLPEKDRAAARAANDAPEAKRTPAQVAVLKQYPNVKSVGHINGQLVEYDPPAHQKFAKQAAEIAALRATKPAPHRLLAVQETPGRVPASRVFLRGDAAQPGKAVAPGELTALAHGGAWRPPAPAKDAPSTGRRLALARHWTSGQHPLVARVFVNRVWAGHFGRGLVGTPGDFGLNGDRPSHPELLDWLADDFVRHGWQVKRLHRQLLLTAAYRQSSARRPALAQVDPDNKLLGRMNLRRLEAEAVRDALLAASGKLHLALGGPSVPVAEDHDGRVVLAERKLKDGLFGGLEGVGDRAFRRSVYLQSKRALPLAMLETFDLPAMTPNCDQRRQSTVATQALLFLNDDLVVQQAGEMAERLRREAPADDARLALAYRILFAAEPTAAELARCRQFLAAETQRARAGQDPAWQATVKQHPHAPEVRALAGLCQTLLCSNRFLYVD